MSRWANAIFSFITLDLKRSYYISNEMPVVREGKNLIHSEKKGKGGETKAHVEFYVSRKIFSA